jgi:hypothetical protein
MVITAFSSTLLVVIIWVLNEPEKFQKWLSFLFSALSHVWKNGKYYTTKFSLESKLNTFVSHLEKNTAKEFPKVKVAWTGRNDEEIVLSEGKAVIVIRDREYAVKNFVHASYLFVSQMLLKNTQMHLSKSQKISFDLYSTKILLEEQEKSAVEQFVRDYISPEISKNENVRSLVQRFSHIHRLGIYFPILIQEMSCLGGKIFLSQKNNELIDEIGRLISFLFEISERKVGDTSIPLEFRGKYMKCAIQIVASKASRERGLTENHAYNIKKYVRERFENIYILGTDTEENNEFMESTVRRCIEEHPGLLLVRECTFAGKIKTESELRRVRTHFVHLHNSTVVEYEIESVKI